MAMTRSIPRNLLLAVALVASGMLVGCDEIEGVYRTLSVRAEVTDACIHQALAAFPGAELSKERDDSRWSVRLSSNPDKSLAPYVVLTRKQGSTELTVLVQRLVGGSKGKRYSLAQITTADKLTADLMNAMVSACLPPAERTASTCKISAQVAEGAKCEHAVQ